MRKAILLVVVVVAVSSVAYAEVLKDYYPSGQLKLEYAYKDGKQEGITKYYYESGQLEWEGNYKDGKREGIGREYYPSGQLKGEAYIMNGALISQKKYDENGNLESD